MQEHQEGLGHLLQLTRTAHFLGKGMLDLDSVITTRSDVNVCLILYEQNKCAWPSVATKVYHLPKIRRWENTSCLHLQNAVAFLSHGGPICAPFAMRLEAESVIKSASLSNLGPRRPALPHPLRLRTRRWRAQLSWRLGGVRGSASVSDRRLCCRKSPLSEFL